MVLRSDFDGGGASSAGSGPSWPTTPSDSAMAAIMLRR
eukprot:CAMPEP_0171266298 /NCGR_PEP_ID=MMETSP0790-20130122/58570_1 /TAXON_ID=2925 /ORGANISM="Alexandrium catenella, Strain OF101" /LENGTH=37 /DNA_ID= /DNA_START= /DNA_END= /DNA_ORIENTATION=